jgi:hypothetical protein
VLGDLLLDLLEGQAGHVDVAVETHVDVAVGWTGKVVSGQLGVDGRTVISSSSGGSTT